MGIFSSIKSNFKMAEAAVVIQNLLEIQESAGLFEGNRSKVANGLVRVAWETNPQIFSGKFGERPHKISVAASALAEAIESNRSDENFYAYVMSLGNIILELQRNGHLYPLNRLDNTLIRASAKVLDKINQEMRTSELYQEVEGILKLEPRTWDEWYAAYKIAAGRTNVGLRPNQRGFSLIDMMVDEPLRRAFADGVDPDDLGEQFGKDFDLSKMRI